MIFGRDDVLAELAARFAAGARAVQLVGFVGVGKTTVGEAFAARHPSVAVLDDAERLAPDARAARLRAGPCLLLTGARVDSPGVETRALEGLVPAAARALWVREVRRRRPDYDADAHDDARALAALLDRVEGHPRAIERLAARRPLADAASLRRRLAEDPATDPLRELLADRAAALSQVARAALAAIGAFEGGFDADALGVVAGADVLDGLAELEARRWARPRGPRRLELHPCVHAYARTVATDDLRRRHRAHFLGWGQARLAVGDHDALFAERQNLARALATDPDARAARLAAAWWPTWQLKGDLGRYERVLDRVLAGELEDGDAARVRLSRAAARLQRGRLADAEDDLREAHRRARAVADRSVRARCCVVLALIRRRQEDFAAATDYLAEGASLAKLARDREVEADAVGRLAGVLHLAGDPAAALPHHRAALALWRRLGHDAAVATALGDLAASCLDLGRLDDARTLLEEARTIHRRLGARRAESHDAHLLAIAALLDGDEARAVALSGEARALLLEPDDVYRSAFLGYEGAAHLLAGDPTRGRARLREAVDARPLAEGQHPSALFVGLLAVACRATGEAELAAAYRAQALATLDARTPAAIRAAVDGLARLADFDGGSPAPLADWMATLDDAWSGAAHEVRLVERLVAAVVGEARPWVFSADGSSARAPSGERLELPGVTLRALVCALVRARLDTPGEPLTPRALAAALWPGEAVDERAAKNRLRVHVSRLRKLGLGELVVTQGSGYRLRDDVAVRLA